MHQADGTDTGTRTACLHTMFGRGVDFYAAVTVEVARAADIEGTELVGRWLDIGEDCGLFLRTDRAFPFTLAGRSHEEVDLRPELPVVT